MILCDYSDQSLSSADRDDWGRDLYKNSEEMILDVGSVTMTQATSDIAIWRSDKAGIPLP